MERYCRKDIKVDLTASIDYIKKLVIDHSEKQIIKARENQQSSTSTKARKSPKLTDQTEAVTYTDKISNIYSEKIKLTTEMVTETGLPKRVLGQYETVGKTIASLTSEEGINFKGLFYARDLHRKK